MFHVKHPDARSVVSWVETDRRSYGRKPCALSKRSAAGWPTRRPGGLVFFGGAGVSTESGIPEFPQPGRPVRAESYPYPPEQMVSRSFFDANPSAFFDFYCDRMLALDAQPNRTHRKLANSSKRARWPPW